MLKACIWSVFAWYWLPIGCKDFHIVRQGEETNETQQQPPPPTPIDNDFTGNLLLSAAINQSQGGEIALSGDTALFPFIQ